MNLKKIKDKKAPKSRGIESEGIQRNYKGLAESRKDFDPFKILATKRDPEVDGVYMLAIEFDGGEKGLAIYSENVYERSKSESPYPSGFIEEPSNLEDYNLTEEDFFKEFPSLRVEDAAQEKSLKNQENLLKSGKI